MSIHPDTVELVDLQEYDLRLIDGQWRHTRAVENAEPESCRLCTRPAIAVALTRAGISSSASAAWGRAAGLLPNVLDPSRHPLCADHVDDWFDGGPNDGDAHHEARVGHAGEHWFAYASELHPGQMAAALSVPAGREAY